MNDFVREFFEDQPELLRRYERNEDLAASEELRYN